MALPVVGALLVFSLMIGPAAAARYFTDRPVAAMALSSALALVTVWMSIAASFWSNWPIGFFVGSLGAAGTSPGVLGPGGAARSGSKS